MQSLGVKNKDFNDFSITEAHLPTELKNNKLKVEKKLKCVVGMQSGCTKSIFFSKIFQHFTGSFGTAELNFFLQKNTIDLLRFDA